jgi:hypothetical protein
MARPGIPTEAPCLPVGCAGHATHQHRAALEAAAGDGSSSPQQRKQEEEEQAGARLSRELRAMLTTGASPLAAFQGLVPLSLPENAGEACCQERGIVAGRPRVLAPEFHMWVRISSMAFLE